MFSKVIAVIVLAIIGLLLGNYLSGGPWQDPVIATLISIILILILVITLAGKEDTLSDPGIIPGLLFGLLLGNVIMWLVWAFFAPIF